MMRVLKTMVVVGKQFKFPTYTWLVFVGRIAYMSHNWVTLLLYHARHRTPYMYMQINTIVCTLSLHLVSEIFGIGNCFLDL